MIELNPEIVCMVIQRAREFQIEEIVSPSETETEFDLSDGVDIEYSGSVDDDLRFQEVSGMIQDLEPDQQVTLVALMWLGRGDYDMDSWEAAITEAGDSWTERTPEYLLSTPMLADYLCEGLEQHGYECP